MRKNIGMRSIETLNKFMFDLFIVNLITFNILSVTRGANKTQKKLENKSPHFWV